MASIEEFDRKYLAAVHEAVLTVGVLSRPAAVGAGFASQT